MTFSLLQNEILILLMDDPARQFNYLPCAFKTGQAESIFKIYFD